MKRVVVYCYAEGDTEKMGEVYRETDSWYMATVLTSDGLAKLGRTYKHNGLTLKGCRVSNERGETCREFTDEYSAAQWFIDNASLGM